MTERSHIFVVCPIDCGGTDHLASLQVVTLPGYRRYLAMCSCGWRAKRQTRSASASEQQWLEHAPGALGVHNWREKARIALADAYPRVATSSGRDTP